MREKEEKKNERYEIKISRFFAFFLSRIFAFKKTNKKEVVHEIFVLCSKFFFR
jgi:hypothetical protein